MNAPAGMFPSALQGAGRACWPGARSWIQTRHWPGGGYCPGGTKSIRSGILEPFFGASLGAVVYLPDEFTVSGIDYDADSTWRMAFALGGGVKIFVHPKLAIVTGMTRDGTFLVEGGKIVGPVKNLRYTQSYLAALAGTVAVARERKTPKGFLGGVVVPAVRIDGWTFTGGTEH
jgi:hypothetical protein